MSRAKLSQDENLSFKINYQLLPKETNQLDLYFSIPTDMGINADTLNEVDFFNANIKSHSAYYSEQLHLPLVQSRFISQNKREKTGYRLNLNLFCYQLRIALDADVKATLQLKEPDEFFPAAALLVEQTERLLKNLRRYTPPDNKLKPYFQNADNYLSWHTEQTFLKLLSGGPKSSEFNDERATLIGFCQQESQYRTEQTYNSQVTLDDPNRITNKMKLLERLIEYGVVFNKQTTDLTLNLKRLVKGLVTGVIMAFVMFIVLNARSNFQEVTVALIVLLGVIYGLRETFKEDLTQWAWRRIQRKRPKWRNKFKNSVNDDIVCTQTIWLEHIRKKDVPPDVNKLLKQRRQQNKQAAHLMHFCSKNQVHVSEFLPGYEEVQQRITFNMASFVRYLKKGAGKLYALEGQKISKKSVERRYQINLVLRFSTDHSTQIERYKLTMNRSEIVAIELMDEAATE
ncbi:hypothetical protein [Pseudoalteromonas aurantia]|uniref:Uncharacterized protein n=1 Tax=Pseudoalteromonas aurantia TaxID=43654 RepID=A0A5S3V485_9GAMM|nr:hypothetical protein [Pseudoalteromonas aurantia]TMO61376.1 hypothetical protein CWC18_12010 [Pseudoalteromonas aurantia]TMO65835.1 hypothetical protein CWC19_17115 [Pseudoalteromonas aurantia]TMO72232.1 hypothetical protein CWC20_15475 [Pseudoalteromonas aurantia]